MYTVESSTTYQVSFDIFMILKRQERIKFVQDANFLHSKKIIVLFSVEPFLPRFIFLLLSEVRKNSAHILSMLFFFVLRRYYSSFSSAELVRTGPDCTLPSWGHSFGQS